MSNEAEYWLGLNKPKEPEKPTEEKPKEKEGKGDRASN